MSYLKLYIDPDNPEDRELAALFKKRHLAGVVYDFPNIQGFTELVIESDKIERLTSREKILECILSE